MEVSKSWCEVIDLLRRNVSHTFVQLPNQIKPMSKLMSAVFILLTLLSITSQATGQQAQPTHQQRRGPLPHMPFGNNPYQVWLGIDVLRYWSPQGTNATHPAPFSRAHHSADIAGVWSAEEIPGLVLTLLLNGSFSLATTANPEKRCSSGVERGSWALTEPTGQLLFYIKTDSNGLCGLSDIGASLRIHKTETGLSAFTGEQGATGGREAPLVRR